MVNITADHLHHMARRHDATMRKLEGLRERWAGAKERVASTVETLGGAWVGGGIEGRTAGAALGPIPINLGVGIVMVAASHFDVGVSANGRTGWGTHLQDVGNGFIGSWAAATGYAFGKRWKESGRMFGGGGHPWSHPYQNGWSNGALLGPSAGPPAGPPPGAPLVPPSVP